jgi:hypothetical protein
MTRTGPDLCSRRPVSSGAFDFVREQLWLARGLAPRLRETLTPEYWDVTTFAEPSVSDARLERFSQGGRLCVADPLDSGALSVIRSAMTREMTAVWLAPDPMAKPQDRFLDDVHRRWFAVDDAVYYVERSPAIDDLKAVWRQTGSAAGQMGLVTTYELPVSALDSEDLNGAASNAVLVVVSAYDGDGVLLLERRRDHARRSWRGP